MNYPGYGGSIGPASLHAIPAAALASYGALAIEGMASRLLSPALASGPRVYVAANRPAAAMILQDPPPLQRMILQKYGWIVPAPVVVQTRSELDSLTNAKRVKRLRSLSWTVGTRPSRRSFRRWSSTRTPAKSIWCECPMPYNAPITGAAAEQFQRELDWIWNNRTNR